MRFKGCTHATDAQSETARAYKHAEVPNLSKDRAMLTAMLESRSLHRLNLLCKWQN